MLNRFLRLTGIERRELPLTLALALLQFGIITAFTVVRTTRDALFLSELPARHMPWLNMTLAVIATGVALIMARLGRRYGSRQIFVGALVVSAAGFLAFLGLARTARHAAAYGLYVWSGVYGLLLVAQFWSMAAERVNSRRARQLYAVIGAGGILGGLVGGTVAVAYVGAMSVEWMLIPAALLHLVVLPTALALDRWVAPEDLAPAPEAARRYVGYRNLLGQRYIRVMAYVFLAAGVASGLLDYIFKSSVQSHFGGNAAAIGVFMGQFYSAQSFIGLILQFGLTSLLLTRLGARGTSLVLPGLFLVFGGALVALPVFGLIAGMRLFDATLRVSIGGTAWEFLYYPLRDDVRQSARRFIDAVVNRCAEALGGALILLIGVVVPDPTRLLMGLLLIPAVIWFLGEIVMSRLYVRELGRSLRRMVAAPHPQAATLNEPELVAQLVELLRSGQRPQVLYALDLLNRTAPGELPDHLPALIHHHEAVVQVRALKLAMEMPDTINLLDIEELTRHPDSEVRVHATLFLYRLVPGGAVGALHDLLTADDPRIRATAFLALVDHAPPDQDEALLTVAERLAAGAPSDRLAVARAIGLRPANEGLVGLLPRFLVDPEVEVRQAAIASAGALRSPEFWPELIRALGHRQLRNSALEAIVAQGPEIASRLGDALLDESVGRDVHHVLPLALARTGGSDAAGILLLATVEGTPDRRRQALKALNRLREENPGVRLPAGEVVRQIAEEAAGMRRLDGYLRAAAELQPGETRRLLERSLRERRAQGQEDLFRRLALIYPPRGILISHRGLTGPNRRVRAQALEYLESVLNSTDRAIVLPLVEEEDIRTRAGGEPAPQTPFTLESTVHELIAHADPWLRAIGVHAAGLLGFSAFRPALAEAAGHPDLLIRDTAIRAMRRLEEARST